MDNYHLKEFSPDRKLFAVIQSDGKLKIWDVERNQLKLDYVPNLHLSTPVTSFKWIQLATGQKKKSKSNESGGLLHIVLGTSRGGIAIFSIATGKIETTFKGDGHSGSVSSIDHDSSFIYTSGSDAKVIKWSIKDCKEVSSFECGPEKPTAICLAGDRIITASKTIKVWGSDSKLAKTFTGHSSNVLVLKSFEHEDATFIVSGAKTDRNLSLWKITDEDLKANGALATFTLLNNSPSCVDYNLDGDRLQIVSVCRSDSMTLFEANLASFKSRKPIKAKFSLEIASDAAGKVNHIPVTAVAIAGDEVIIGYGEMLMKFERVSSLQNQRNVILVRKDPVHIDVVKRKKEDTSETMNLKTPLTDDTTEVLNVITATRKSQKPVEIPLETRLDNLTVGESKKPNAKKMTHQLVQGLHGGDANILRNVLRQTDEETVRMTVKYLPSQYVLSLVNELSLLMTKKTAGSEIALVWLRNLIQVHSSSLMAYGIENLNATFGTTLGIIDHRAQNLPGLMRLRGRLELLVKQVKQSSDIDDEIRNDNVLVYEDSDDESVNMDAKSGTSDEDIFDEFEDEEEQVKTNGTSNSELLAQVEDEDDDDDEEMDYSD